jgi:hypothetical protein
VGDNVAKVLARNAIALRASVSFFKSMISTDDRRCGCYRKQSKNFFEAHPARADFHWAFPMLLYPT